MSEKLDFVERQWRYTKRFMVFFPFWILLIAVINIWSDRKGGNPFNWDDVIYPIGMLAFALVLFVFMRLIFKFVRSYTEHDDKRSKP